MTCCGSLKMQPVLLRREARPRNARTERASVPGADLDQHVLAARERGGCVEPGEGGTDREPAVVATARDTQLL